MYIGLINISTRFQTYSELLVNIEFVVLSLRLRDRITDSALIDVTVATNGITIFKMSGNLFQQCRKHWLTILRATCFNFQS